MQYCVANFALTSDRSPGSISKLNNIITYFISFKAQHKSPELVCVVAPSLSTTLGSKLHKIYAISCDKRGLCSFDDKRFLLDDAVHSLAYGHYSITNQVHRDDINIAGGEQVMSNKDARDKGLIWSRRTEVLSLMGGKDHEWNESNKEAVVSGVKAKLALMQVSEEIVKSADAVEVPTIVDTESSVEQGSSYVDESRTAEKKPIKRSKRQKPIKSTKRRRKESVFPNANANE